MLASFNYGHASHLKKSFVIRFILGLALILLAYLILTPKAHAADDQLYPSDVSTHYAISAKSGNWIPPKNSAGTFIAGGDYNCKHPAIYPPDATHPPQDEGACTTGLDATKTRYKLFRNSNSGSTTLRIVDGCKDTGNYNGVEGGTPYNKAPHPDKGSRKIDVSVYQTRQDGSIPASYASATDNYSGNFSTNCSGDTLLVDVPGSAFTLNQKDRFGDEYTAQVVIYKHNNQEGQKTFKLLYSVAGGEVHGDDDGQFALASSQPPSSGPDGYSDYTFTFQPDCKYKEGEKVYLNLGDFDFNDLSLNPGFPPVYLRAPNEPTKKLFPSGNQGNQVLDMGYLKQKTNYTLTIEKIKNNNGLRFQLPFSEYLGARQCDPPPCTGSCANPPNCERYEDILHNNSRYKFRLYNVDHGASSSSYLTAPSTISSSRVFSGDYATKTSGYVKSLPDGVNPTSGNQPYGPEEYPSPTGRDWVVVVERSEHLSNGNYQWTSSVHREGVNCYSATCTINFAAASELGTTNGVKAGESFTIGLTIKSTGQAGLPFTVASGGGLSVTRTGTFAGPSYTHHTGHLFTGGPAFPFTVNVTAPGTINSYALSAYPQYFNGDYNHFKLGPNCNSPNVDVYKQFDISPTALLSMNSQNPAAEGITYSTKGTKNNPAEVDISTTAISWLSKEPFGGSEQTVDGKHSVGHSYGSEVKDEFPVYNPSNVTVGDKYCSNLNISPGKGWVGPGGTIAPGEREDVSARNCDTVNNAPYIHILNSDASAGGGFGSNCSTNNGGIKTFFNNNAGNITGSGVQIGALSINPIYGFSSALLRNTAPNPPTGLSFSNNKHLTGGGYNAGVGGGLKGTHCVKDYFSTKPAATVADSSTSVNASSLSGVKYYTPGGGTGTLDINAGTIAAGTNTAVFVKGNVRITGDIKYANSANWGTIEDVPSFKLIVYGGKITINNSVSQLDGLYVSQPEGNNGGRIDTCEVTSLDSLLTSCDNQLVVNGGFVGKQIYLLRSFGSLRDTVNTPGERLNASTKSCSVLAAGGKRNTGNGDCSSEIFNFSPEMYLNQSDGTTPDSGPTTGGFDYITSLAPVL